jgi:PAS domain S-box-containing protein
MRQRLAELEDIVAAIQEHRVDAFLVQDASVARVCLLETAERPYRALIEDVHQGVATLDEHGRVLFCNQRLAALCGKHGEDRAALVGSCFESLFPPAERSRVAWLLERARSGLVQATLHLSCGSQAPLQVHLSLDTLPAGSGATFGVLMTDVSREIADRQLSRRKSEFMALLAHELRNPLGTARNAVAVVRQLASTDEKQRLACDWIERQIVVMSRLVDDLLDVERLEHGKVELRPEPLDLARLVEVVCGDLRPEAEAAGLRLEVVLSSAEAWVRGDPLRLGQVFGNLLHNAIKFSAHGGRIGVTLETSGAEVVVNVWDEGAGIEPELLEDIFQPFSQGRGGGSGLGLGLALVRGLIELHEGSVEAASPGPGGGARFTVRLPLLADERG